MCDPNSAIVDDLEYSWRRFQLLQAFLS